MDVFKNKVGRPSRDTITKRRIYATLILVFIITVVTFILYATSNYMDDYTEGTSKNARAGKTITATFYANGSKISQTKARCKLEKGKDYCTVKLAKITPKSGYSVVGWGTSAKAHTASSKSGATVKLTKNTTYYAITKKKLTATFYDKDLDYIQAKTRKCAIYNKEKSCTIILPRFNRRGSFNVFWSTSKKASSDLAGQKFNKDYFYQVDKEFTLTEDITLYPNYNTTHYNSDKILFKYRDLSIKATKMFGDVMVEYENGISWDTTHVFDPIFSTGRKKYPWLFVPSKVFVLSEEAFKKYSSIKSLGETNNMTIDGGESSYSVIDVRVDIDTNGIYHELAHALDNYYKFKTHKTKAHETPAFSKFYVSVKNKIYTKDNVKISKGEFFAAMVTNFIWHYNNENSKMGYYGLQEGQTLTKDEIETFGKLLDSCLQEMGMKGSIMYGTGTKIE